MSVARIDLARATRRFEYVAVVEQTGEHVRKEARSGWRSGLAKIWGATEAVDELPAAGTRELALQKYSSDAWNLKFQVQGKLLEV